MLKKTTVLRIPVSQPYLSQTEQRLVNEALKEGDISGYRGRFY